MKKIRIITIAFLLLFFIPLSSASISYDPSTNTITIIGDATCGNSEANACGFEDIYNADKAGTLTLIDRDGITGTDTDPVNNAYNLRPADEKVMGGAKHDLWIEIENWNGFTNATIRLIGKDEAGNDQTEDIVVTGDGTYYSDELWTELTQTQVVGVSGSGSLDYNLAQGQWGVVSKQGGNQYYFSCKLQIGDGSTETWLIDTKKAISFTLNDDFITIKNYGHLRCGEVISESKRTSKDGCYFYSSAPAIKKLIYVETYGTLELYSSLINSKAYLQIDSSKTNKIWNSIIIGAYCSGYPTPQINIYKVIWSSATYGIQMVPINASDVTIANCYYGMYLKAMHSSYYISNFKMIDETYSFRTYNFDGNLYAIDTDCKWTFYWGYASPGKIYRQYTFTLKVVDTAGNPIPGASVKIWDKNNNLVVDETTDANGEIPEQTLTYGYYNQAHGNTPVMQTPHTIRIAKAGYQTYEKQFTLDKKIDWMIALTVPPKITDWYNNHTNDNSTFVHINTSTCIYFNVTTNQPIEKFHWYLNGKFLYNNYDNITICWNNTEETGILKVWGENSNGTTNTVVWYVGENMSMLNESINLLLEEGEMTGLSLLLGILIIVALVFLLLGVLVPNSVLTLMGAITSFIAMALPIPMMPDYPYFGIALTGVLFLFGIIGLIITFYQWLTSYHQTRGYHKWERYFE